ncbi:MAG: hypothetical protein HY064_07390 [Bacteroidetes bacterium]|nr:hypothetical protein [Bacteroidota bacterium]
MRLLITLAFSGLFFCSAPAQDLTSSDVSLKSFNAIARGKQVLLSWNTDVQGVKNYSLEKSRNGSDFVDFGNVQAADINTDYIETDFQPFDGLSYYRLKLVGADGSVSYSNAVPVKYNENGEPVSPVEGTSYNHSSSDNSMLVVVMNPAGEQYYSKVEVTANGNPVECIDPDPLLASGTYTIIGCSDQEFYSKQILVK